jgi:hypothetical protein
MVKVANNYHHQMVAGKAILMNVCEFKEVLLHYLPNEIKFKRTFIRKKL